MSMIIFWNFYVEPIVNVIQRFIVIFIMINLWENLSFTVNLSN